MPTTCQDCGSIYPNTDSYCTECGTPLPTDAPAPDGFFHRNKYKIGILAAILIAPNLVILFGIAANPGAVIGYLTGVTIGAVALSALLVFAGNRIASMIRRAYRRAV